MPPFFFTSLSLSGAGFWRNCTIVGEEKTQLKPRGGSCRFDINHIAALKHPQPASPSCFSSQAVQEGRFPFCLAKAVARVTALLLLTSFLILPGARC